MRHECGVRLRQALDHLRLELLELATRDDRDLDTLGQSEQQVAHARVDRGLRRSEGVVEVEGDEAGRGIGHGAPEGG